MDILEVNVDRIGWQPEQPGKGQIKLYEIYVYALAYDRDSRTCMIENKRILHPTETKKKKNI